MPAQKSTVKEVAGSFWPPLAVVALHAVLTVIFGHQRWLDPSLHFLGGAAALYTCSRLLQMALAIKGKSPVALLLVILIVLLWEVGEFLSDTFIGTHVQHGLFDTGSDIILGLAGALLYYIALQRTTATNTVVT